MPFLAKSVVVRERRAVPSIYVSYLIRRKYACLPLWLRKGNIVLVRRPYIVVIWVGCDRKMSIIATALA